MRPKSLAQYLTKPNPENEKSETVKHKKAFKLKKIFKSLLDNKYENCVYGITLTLNHNKKVIQDFESDQDLHRFIHNKISRSRVWKDCIYILFPEYSPKGKLHYHGVIFDCYQVKASNISRWWQRNFGFTKLEIKISSMQSWLKYITKDYSKSGLWYLENIPAPADFKI